MSSFDLFCVCFLALYVVLAEVERMSFARREKCKK